MWASYTYTVYLSVHICKMGINTEPPPQGSLKMKGIYMKPSEQCQAHSKYHRVLCCCRLFIFVFLHQHHHHHYPPLPVWELKSERRSSFSQVTNYLGTMQRPTEVNSLPSNQDSVSPTAQMFPLHACGLTVSTSFSNPEALLLAKMVPEPRSGPGSCWTGTLH